MFVRCRNESVKHAAFAAVLTVLIAPTQPASAEGFFEALFGGFDRAIRREMRLPPRANSYVDPYGYDGRRERRTSPREYAGPGPSSGFCVRTCDGKYFAVRSSGPMSATELCRAFCPAAKTKVFAGGRIEHSVASDGTRYADLDSAFLYRERRVDNCTCNGKTPYGLATLDPESDPTLRAGDIVATNDGLAVYSGNRSKSAEFTPIEQAGGSSEWRRRLMSIKVAPAPERAETPVVPPDEESAERTGGRRAQR